MAVKCIVYNGGYKYQLKEECRIATPIIPQQAIESDYLSLDNDTWREPADRLLQAICREDGMWQLRAWWVYLGVRWFGDPAADPARKRPSVYAPGGCER